MVALVLNFHCKKRGGGGKLLRGEIWVHKLKLRLPQENGIMKLCF